MAVHETAVDALSEGAGCGKAASAENAGDGGVVAVVVCAGGAAGAVGAGPAYVVSDGRWLGCHTKVHRKRVDGEPRVLKQPRRQRVSKRRPVSNSEAGTAAALRHVVVGPRQAAISAGLGYYEKGTGCAPAAFG